MAGIREKPLRALSRWKFTLRKGPLGRNGGLGSMLPPAPLRGLPHPHAAADLLPHPIGFLRQPLPPPPILLCPSTRPPPEPAGEGGSRLHQGGPGGGAWMGAETGPGGGDQLWGRCWVSPGAVGDAAAVFAPPPAFRGRCGRLAARSGAVLGS